MTDFKKELEKEFEKEFELERVILFSDAVFAIAITLLIIEIKFPELPENYKNGFSLYVMFKPVIAHFSAFIISFFFIGISWARHLKLFSYLKSYNNGVIFLNLLNLFFIVTFPFVATGITHTRPSFPLPIVLYIGNIVFLFITNAILAHYVFKTKPYLCKEINNEEKAYQYKKNVAPAIAMAISFLILLVVAIASNFNSEYINYSLWLFIISVMITNRLVKKLKPKVNK